MWVFLFLILWSYLFLFYHSMGLIHRPQWIYIIIYGINRVSYNYSTLVVFVVLLIRDGPLSQCRRTCEYGIPWIASIQLADLQSVTIFYSSRRPAKNERELNFPVHITRAVRRHVRVHHRSPAADSEVCTVSLASVSRRTRFPTVARFLPHRLWYFSSAPTIGSSASCACAVVCSDNIRQ